MKRNIIILLGLIFCLSVSAHSGRLDGQGGHRVNKKWEYEGKYIILNDGVRLPRKGIIKFFPGDYHYHIHPNYIPNIKNGVFLPIGSQDIKSTITENIYISAENRVSSKNSDKYHEPDCFYINNIKETNIVIFEDFEEAENNDYIPCKICKPDSRR